MVFETKVVKYVALARGRRSTAEATIDLVSMDRESFVAASSKSGA